jgi:hypothetical protein
MMLMGNHEKDELIGTLRSLLPESTTQLEYQNVDLSLTLALALKRLEKLDLELSTEIAVIFIGLTDHLFSITEAELQQRLLSLQEKLQSLNTSLSTDDSFWDAL